VRVGALWDNAINDGVCSARNVGNDAGNRRNRCGDIQRTLNHIAQLASDCGLVAVRGGLTRARRNKRDSESEG
jgi:hypothetical protein